MGAVAVAAVVGAEMGAVAAAGKALVGGYFVVEEHAEWAPVKNLKKNRKTINQLIKNRCSFGNRIVYVLLLIQLWIDTGRPVRCR